MLRKIGETTGNIWKWDIIEIYRNHRIHSDHRNLRIGNHFGNPLIHRLDHHRLHKKRLRELSGQLVKIQSHAWARLMRCNQNQGRFLFYFWGDYRIATEQLWQLLIHQLPSCCGHPPCCEPTTTTTKPHWIRGLLELTGVLPSGKLT